MFSIVTVPIANSVVSFGFRCQFDAGEGTGNKYNLHSYYSATTPFGFQNIKHIQS
ncbi:hypothetical protein NSTC745_03761 [Nostoc sp. DSM 114161]|jgi:hypothetical protein